MLFEFCAMINQTAFILFFYEDLIMPYKLKDGFVEKFEAFKEDLKKQKGSEEAALNRKKATDKEHKLRKKGREELEGADAEAFWEEVKKAADKLLQEGMAGYDNLVIAWLRILNESKIFHEAIRKSDPMAALSGLTSTVGEKFKAQLKGMGFSQAEVSKEDIDPKELLLIAMQQLVKMTPNGELSDRYLDTRLEREDGQDLRAEDKILICAAITVWLDTLGYDPSPTEPRKFVSRDTGKVLTQHQFESLQAEDPYGLAKCLHERAGIDVESILSPRMS